MSRCRRSHGRRRVPHESHSGGSRVWCRPRASSGARPPFVEELAFAGRVPTPLLQGVRAAFPGFSAVPPLCGSVVVHFSLPVSRGFECRDFEDALKSPCFFFFSLQIVLLFRILWFHVNLGFVFLCTLCWGLIGIAWSPRSSRAVWTVHRGASSSGQARRLPLSPFSSPLCPAGVTARGFQVGCARARTRQAERGCHTKAHLMVPARGGPALMSQVTGVFQPVWSSLGTTTVWSIVGWSGVCGLWWP